MQTKWVLAAFLVLVFGIMLAFSAAEDNSDDKLYKSLIETCDRANAASSELNRRVQIHSVQNKLIVQLIDREARRLSDEKQYHLGAELMIDATTLKQNSVFRPQALVDCKEVVDRP
jgi:hypothetical protein